MRFDQVKWSPCYCGGFVQQVLTIHKRLYFGWKYYYYKNPKWQIVNCYSKEIYERESQ